MIRVRHSDIALRRARSSSAGGVVASVTSTPLLGQFSAAGLPRRPQPRALIVAHAFEPHRSGIEPHGIAAVTVGVDAVDDARAGANLPRRHRRDDQIDLTLRT